MKVEAERVSKIRETGLKAMQDKERVLRTIFYELVTLTGPLVHMYAFHKTPAKDRNA